MSDVGKAGRPTNWYGLISAAAATVVIVGAIFGLAEWRVANASTPLYEAARETRANLQKAQEQLIELRIKQAVSAAENERIKIEQEARIRSRVDAEQRATERVPQPPR